ncbi:putative MFS transporter [Massarina eburnea CBS 473.64]|uniref:Putative MFS transporter n=1 Tax=Massarina eburnea CBS 473.64 TaxID=1395130 RepID=A0A6A6RSS3_9PLEO|nr:putative MFS transporter [Massarina eburnea CBS 473.64]
MYDTIPMWRKCVIVFVTSWTTLSACFSSTSLLSATHEIAVDMNTTTEAVSLSTAGLLVAMGLSPLVWSPIASIIGRRMAYIACLGVLFAFTIGAAVAQSMEVFVAMRVLSGLQGCFFHVAGQTILAEYFPPLQRGTATGFFLAGTVLGPPLGPLIAGIMMTYSTWRSVLWLQVVMIGISFLLAVLFVPPTRTDASGFALNMRGRNALVEFDPRPVFQQMMYPNVIFTHLSCGFLSWSQYALLSAPRHILSTRFGLSSPLSSGLFYIAPVTGFLLGTVVGGRYSDMTVCKWIARRGTRLPQDRLNSGMWAFFFFIPAASLIYGWGLECERCSTARAGLALPIVTSFFMAAGLLAAFASLNTYCAEAFPKKRREVIAGKYLVQYVFSAASSAGCVPLIEAIGVGPTATIGVMLVLFAGTLTFLTAKYASSMVEWRDREKSEKRLHSRWPAMLPAESVFPIA